MADDWHQKGTTADCTRAGRLIEGMDSKYLLVDRDYNSNTIVEQAQKQKTKVMILPRKNRKIQRTYNKKLYKPRQLVENAFLHLKRW